MENNKEQQHFLVSASTADTKTLEVLFVGSG